MGNKKILIVDNSPVFLSLLGRFLVKQGHVVFTAENGLKALEIVQNFKPDVIFIDYVMPGIDGAKLCRKFRQNSLLKKTTIVLISALALERDLNHIEAGFDACVAKGPFAQMSLQIQNFLNQLPLETEARHQQRRPIGSEHVYKRAITQELLAVQEHLEGILSSISEGIVEITEKGKILYANPAAADIIEKSELELLGSDFPKLFQNPAWETISEGLNRPRSAGFVGKAHDLQLVNGRVVSLKKLPVGNLKKTQVIVISDITDAKMAENALRYHTDFEKLITEILARFVDLPAKEVDHGIREALEEIGTFAGVDRSYVFLFSENGQKMDDAYEWCAPGIVPQVDNMQGMELEKVYPWFAQVMKNREVVMLSSLDELPAEADAERKEFKRQGIQSIINVPIVSGGTMVGFLGFDAVRAAKQWTTEMVPLLKIMGEVTANALTRSRTDMAIRESEKKFRELADLLPQVIFETDLLGNFVFVNRQAVDSFGPTDPGATLTSLQYIVPEHKTRAIKHFQRILRGENPPAAEFDFMRENGMRMSLIIHCAAIIRHGKAVGLRGVAVDITERKRTERQLKYMSTHDTLTGLYNRGFFEEELRRLEKGRKFPINILMIDIDNLKETNDTLGHAAGDELIRRTATVLKEAFRKEDVVARLGGDEFAAAWTGSSEAKSHAFQKRIERLLSVHNTRHEGLPLMFSIGFAAGGRGATCQDLLKAADRNMYDQKASRKRTLKKSA